MYSEGYNSHQRKSCASYVVHRLIAYSKETMLRDSVRLSEEERAAVESIPTTCINPRHTEASCEVDSHRCLAKSSRTLCAIGISASGKSDIDSRVSRQAALASARAARAYVEGVGHVPLK